MQVCIETSLCCMKSGSRSFPNCHCALYTDIFRTDGLHPFHRIVHFVGSPHGPPVFFSDLPLACVPFVGDPLAPFAAAVLEEAASFVAAAGAAGAAVAAASDWPPCSQPKCLAATDQK